MTRPKAQSGRLKPDSLGFAMLVAAQACMRVRTGQALPEALKTVLSGHSQDTPEADARQNLSGAVQDIAYRTMRGRGRADAWLALLAQRELSSPLLRELLVVAMVLLDIALESTESDQQAPYSTFTVVDQAVEAAASHADLKNAKGFVNAVLRSLMRDRERLLPSVLSQIEARWNYPTWWVYRLQQAYPDRWQELLTLGDEPPPLTLRVNQRKTTVEAYQDLLTQAGLHGTLIGASAIRLDKAVPVSRIPGFGAGLVSVQDEAAQRAAALLDIQNGMRVLDACAAPGGKTCHLLELADVDVTALDVDARRLQRVQENLDRLDLKARLLAGSASWTGERPDWWDGQPYDRILADVPCTASGIVRRHPDIRWLRREADITTLSRIQQQILDSLWRLLKPGGKLLLVTCSLFPEESSDQARAFATRHADAGMPSAPGQLLPTRSHALEHDGLFFSLFQKEA